MRDFKEASNYVEDIYKNLNKIAQDVVSKHTQEIDRIIKSVKVDLPNEELRKASLELAIANFYLSELREQSALKSDCAESVKKETQALEFNNASGTQAQKQNVAITSSNSEQMVALLYKNINSLFAVKLDESRRMINTITNILISRAADKKSNS